MRRMGRRGAPIGRRCAWSRRRANLENAIPSYRVDDVLQVLLAEAVEADGQLVVHLIVDRAGDQDSPRVGQLLQSRGDIDAVAINIVALHHHVAEMDPDADAWELGDDGVAPSV